MENDGANAPTTNSGSVQSLGYTTEPSSHSKETCQAVITETPFCVYNHFEAFSDIHCL